MLTGFSCNVDGVFLQTWKQSPTPTPTSSSLFKLVHVEFQVGVEFDKNNNDMVRLVEIVEKYTEKVLKIEEMVKENSV